MFIIFDKLTIQWFKQKLGERVVIKSEGSQCSIANRLGMTSNSIPKQFVQGVGYPKYHKENSRQHNSTTLENSYRHDFVHVGARIGKYQQKLRYKWKIVNLKTCH